MNGKLVQFMKENFDWFVCDIIWPDKGIFEEGSDASIYNAMWDSYVRACKSDPVKFYKTLSGTSQHKLVQLSHQW